MNYINQKFWLVLELDAVNYRMLSITSNGIIKYKYTFSATTNNSEIISNLNFNEIFTDSFNILTSSFRHIPLKIVNTKHNVIRYTDITNVKHSKGKLASLKNKSVVKDLTNLKFTIEDSLYTEIVNYSSINSKNDTGFTSNIVKYTVLSDDSVINSGHTLHSNFQTPTYLEFNSKDKISSKNISVIRCKIYISKRRI